MIRGLLRAGLVGLRIGWIIDRVLAVRAGIEGQPPGTSSTAG
jgi:hypothetical protein